MVMILDKVIHKITAIAGPKHILTAAKPPGIGGDAGQ